MPVRHTELHELHAGNCTFCGGPELQKLDQRQAAAGEFMRLQTHMRELHAESGSGVHRAVPPQHIACLTVQMTSEAQLSQ